MSNKVGSIAIEFGNPNKVKNSNNCYNCTHLIDMIFCPIIKHEIGSGRAGLYHAKYCLHYEVKE